MTSFVRCCTAGTGAFVRSSGSLRAREASTAGRREKFAAPRVFSRAPSGGLPAHAMLPIGALLSVKASAIATVRVVVRCTMRAQGGHQRASRLKHSQAGRNIDRRRPKVSIAGDFSKPRVTFFLRLQRPIVRSWTFAARVKLDRFLNRGSRIAVRTFTIRHTRTIAVVLAVALTFAVSATCVVAAETTAAQQACRAAMSHDCGRMAQAQSCCHVESLWIEQGAVLAKFSPDPPSVVVAAVLPRISSDALIARPPSASRAGFAPAARGVPTYVLASAFRI